MSRFVALLLAVFLALSPLPLNAQDGPPYPLTSSVIIGPGLEGLEITGEPDEHGLIWHIREPQRKFESWVVVAYNAGDEPVSNVHATLEYLVDGKWYLANLDAKDRMLYPGSIQPGEFGFQKMGGVMAAPTPWDDSRIVVESVNAGTSTEIVSLGLEDGGISPGGYFGTFVNGTGQTVEKITLVVGCVVDGEIIDTDFFVHDLLKLESGGKDDFEFQGAVCDEPDQTILYIAARVR
jgi:hypothetical protein